MTVVREWAKAQALIVVMGILILGHPGCGIDVGNAGKPAPTQSNLQLASVAGLQHDEAIGAILDGEDADRDDNTLRLLQDSSLGLLAEPGCTENSADGSVTLVRNNEGTFSREFGRPANRKTLTDSILIERSMTWAAKDRAITCNGERPVLSWKQVSELSVDSSYKKSRKRQVTLQSTGEVIGESSVKASGERTLLYKKEEESLQRIVTRRTITFKSQLTRQKADETLERSIANVEGQPIILINTFTRGSGRTVRILSGAVEATAPGEKRTILRYENIDLNPGTSCHPVSGVLKGEVYSDLDAGVLESTFEIVFSTEGAVIRQADGSEEELELESCVL